MMEALVYFLLGIMIGVCIGLIIFSWILRGIKPPKREDHYPYKLHPIPPKPKKDGKS